MDKVTVVSRRSAVAVFMVLILSLSVGCDKKATDPNPGTPQSIDEAVNLGGDFPPVVESEEVIDSSTTVHEENGTIWRCSSKTYSVTKAPEDYPNFNPNAEIVFPGNLLQGATLDEATPEPVSVSRAGGTVVMNIINGGQSYSETVPVVNLDNIVAAQNKILSNFTGPKPANFTFTMEEVTSQQHLALALDVNYKALTTKVKSSLEFSRDRIYNRFLVKLNQQYFSMIYQLPTDYSQVFASNVGPEDLVPFISAGNPATFISSVTYGRIFYMLIESTSSKTEMEASIDASFRAAVASGSMGADARYVNSLENRKVKAFALGGDDQKAIAAVIGGFDALKDYLTQGADIRTGVPLSYQVRALKKPYPVVKTKVATEYDVQDCVPIALNSQYEIFCYRADSLVVEQNGKVMEWGDSFGKGNKAILVDQNNNLPITLQDNQVNNLPALRFWSVNGTPGDYLTNNPGHFVNTDYTIFAVLKIKLGWWMWGSDRMDYRMLHSGYRNENTFTMDHYNQWLNVSTKNLGDYQLFTLVFSTQNGMTVYENGVMRGADANNTHPLDSNNNPSIGLNYYWGSTTEDGFIAEIRAYGQALQDTDRKIIEEMLMRKYSLGPY